uniref:Putative secreted protein n=1 Tax=Anopheles darlingi TaxID=43151 RepID=A0A2M4DSL9_ANODA
MFGRYAFCELLLITIRYVDGPVMSEMTATVQLIVELVVVVASELISACRNAATPPIAALAGSQHLDDTIEQVSTVQEHPVTSITTTTTTVRHNLITVNHGFDTAEY